MMENAVKRFARRVLIIHLFLLFAVLALVAMASREVYQSARRHTLQQAQQRQTLLAEQTARGIQGLYESVLSDLELMHPANPDDPQSPYTNVPSGETVLSPSSPRNAFPGPILSQQLEGRVSHLFVVDKSALRARWIGIGQNETSPSIAQIIARSGSWLRSLQRPAISDFELFGERGLHLICIPVGPRNRTVLVAAVPVWRIERRFLDELNRHNVGSAFLVDDDMILVAAARHDLVGTPLDQKADPGLKAAIDGLIANGRQGTRVLTDGFSIGKDGTAPVMLTAEPVRVSDKQWFVLVSSPLSQIDSVVRQVFHRAVFWAIFVAGSISAILLSTSVQLIRGRVRLEQVRGEVITRELQEARRIQLAWLPEREHAAPGLQIATVNHPASHISGDFYNYFDLPDGRTALVIGDVTGHGMSAAFLMATAQLLVRTTLPGYCDPAACLAEVNRQLCVQMFNGQFVTMIVAILDPRQGRLQIASAGHPAPLIDDGSGFRVLPMDSGLLLGVEREAHYRTFSFELSPRASLLMYTDGIVEAEAPDRSRLSVKGLLQRLPRHGASAQHLIQSVIGAVTEFRKQRSLNDDMTILAAIIDPASVESEVQWPASPAEAGLDLWPDDSNPLAIPPEPASQTPPLERATS